jgi:hypothetical protein
MAEDLVVVGKQSGSTREKVRFQSGYQSLFLTVNPHRSSVDQIPFEKICHRKNCSRRISYEEPESLASVRSPRESDLLETGKSAPLWYP